MLKFFTYTTLVSILVGAGIALETHSSTTADTALGDLSTADTEQGAVAQENTAPLKAKPAETEAKEAEAGNLALGHGLITPGTARVTTLGGNTLEHSPGTSQTAPIGPTSTPVPAHPSPSPSLTSRSTPTAPTPPVNPALVPWGEPLPPLSQLPETAETRSQPPPTAINQPSPSPSALPAAIAPALASINKPLPVQLSSEAASSRFLSPHVPSEFSPEQPPIPALW